MYIVLKFYTWLVQRWLSTDAWSQWFWRLNSTSRSSVFWLPLHFLHFIYLI